MKNYVTLAVAAVTALSAHVLAPTQARAANVLVLLSDSDHLDLKDGKVYRTGFYLNELMQPVKLLLDAGHHLTFVTPKGHVPTLDQTSVNPALFGGSQSVMQAHQKLMGDLGITAASGSPVVSLARVEQIGLDRFDAVYVPGGHAPMQDLFTDPGVGRLLSDFHRKGKVTALTCHGPIALAATLDDPAGFAHRLETGADPKPGKWIYAGYSMTVISDQEEEQAKGYLGGGTMRIYPQDALQAAGGRYSSNAEPWTEHVVADRELITGQNPASALGVGRALVERLHPTPVD